MRRWEGTQDSIVKKQSKHGRAESCNTGREKAPESAIIKVPPTPGFLPLRSASAVLYHLLCSLINHFDHTVILKRKYILLKRSLCITTLTGKTCILRHEVERNLKNTIKRSRGIKF